MKPRVDIKHQGTIGTQDRTAMTFDENSLAHLMAVLTDLYSDPALAVIREYSTNAFDSHIDAGVDRPIEVDLPSDLRRMFVVRDRGLGLSKEDIVENFSKYGWSSKRDTDEQVGMLGLGCKSALTYTSQFTFIATKDGIRSTVLVTRDETGASSLQIMESVETDEHNGVEVQIPVKDNVKDFNDKANGFYKYWNPGTVYVNGEPVESIWETEGEGITKLDDDILLRPKGGSRYDYNLRRHVFTEGDVIVMGNVPYPCKTPLTDRLNSGVVVRVPVGAVNFTPSREELQYTAMTNQTIADVKNYIDTSVLHQAQAEIESQPTAHEALAVAEKWRRNSNQRLFDKVTYRSTPIPTSFKNDHTRTMQWAPDYGGFTVQTRASRRQGAIFTNTTSERTLFVIGHSAQQIAPGTKSRIIKYMVDEKLDVDKVYLCPGDPFGDWVKNKVTLEDLKSKYTLPKQTRTRNSTPGLRVLHADGSDAVRDDVDDKTVKVAVVAGDGDYIRSIIGQYTCGSPDDVVGVVVASNREESFIKKTPNAISAKDYAKQEVEKYLKSLTPIESLMIRGLSSNVSKVYRIAKLLESSDTILDKRFHKVVDSLSSISYEPLERKNTLMTRVAYIGGFTFELPKADVRLPKLADKLVEEYPMLRHNLSSTELPDYLNATYLYNKRKNRKTNASV